MCEETLGKHVTGKFLTLAAQLRNTTFISKNGIQFGASGRASVGRVGENRRVRGDWRDRGVERHVRRYVEHRISLGGISFRGERSRWIDLLVFFSLSSPFTKPFMLSFEED